MKKLLFVLALCTFGLTSPSFAASGLGCNVWGPVSYVYFGNNSGTNSTILAIINGYVCIVSGSTTSLTPMVSVLANAEANGKQGYMTDTTAAVQ